MDSERVKNVLKMMAERFRSGPSPFARATTVAFLDESDPESDVGFFDKDGRLFGSCSLDFYDEIMRRRCALTDEERKAEFEKLIEENAQKMEQGRREGKFVSVVIPIVAKDGKCYAHGVEYDNCPECWAGYG